MAFSVSSRRLMFLAKSTTGTALLAGFLSLQFSFSATAQTDANGSTTSPSGVFGVKELDSLSNTQSATTVIDFGKSNVLNISGVLQNFGTIYLVSSNPAILHGVLNAGKIVNNSGATISSVLPAGGLPGFDFLVPNFSFTLNASGNLINRGVISSAGSLSINAAQIINSPAMNAAANSASITAMANLNLNSMLGSVVNSGNIASLNGNVNITAPMGKDLIINNSSGIIQALMGSVNLGDTLATVKQNVALLGGNLSARELNLNAACGTAIVNADEINAVLNVVANETHVMTASPTLHLGEISLSGDPTFFNTSGDIFIDSNLVFAGAPLAIVASGSILSAPGAGRIETGGGDITMISGVSFYSSAGPSVTNPFASFTLTMNGPSLTGGKIDLSGADPITSLDSGGGKILLMANNGATPGLIKLPDTVTVKSRGGDILMLATGIIAGTIDSSGSQKNGNISIYRNYNTGCPGCTITNSVFSGELPPSFVENLPFEPVPQLAFWVDIDGVKSGGGNILIFAEIFSVGTIDASASSAKGGNIDVAAQSFTFELGTGANQGIGSIIASGQSQGGNVLIRNLYNVNFLNTTSIDLSAKDGNAGKLEVRAGDEYNPAIVTINTGKLSFNGTGANGNGGELVLSAGEIMLSSHTILEANGSGTGSGGKIKVWSGSSQPTLLPDIGLGAGELELSANSGVNGGNGGTVDLSADQVLVDPSALHLNPLGAEGNGGNFSLQGDAFVSSDLVLNGKGHGNGGSVSIDSTFVGTDISIGPTVTDHGVRGLIGADSGPLGGSGGSINLKAANLSIADSSSLSIIAVSGDGGSLSLKSETGSILLPSGTISVDGTAANSNGGKINLYAAASIDAPPGQAIFLSAAGKGQGNGGKIEVHSLGSPFSTGTGAGQLQAVASSGASGGNGGSVILESSTLTVDPSDIDVAPKGASGDGGSILLYGGSINVTGSLQANGVGSGKGGTIAVSTTSTNLFVDGSIIANGAGTGDGGSISLMNAINIGAGTTSQGVNGVLQANSGPLGGAGGSILADTSFWSITLSSVTDLSATAKDGKGGTIRLFQLVDVLSGGGTIDVSGAGAHGDGGIFEGRSISLPGHLTIAANGSGDGNGGQIYIGGVIGNGASETSLQANGGSPGSLKGDAGEIGLNAVIHDVSAIQASPLGVNGNGAHLFLAPQGGYSGNIDASGKGTGDGGYIQFYAGSAIDSLGPGAVVPNGVDGTLSANSDSGKGGKIIVRSSYDFTLLPAAISVQSANGAGGEIWVDANKLILAGGSSLNADAGNGNGGIVLVYTVDGIVNNSAATISANGAGDGNGGIINVYSYGDLDLANTQVLLQANSGTKSGHGGTIHLEANQALSADMARVEAGAKGSTGNGGTLEFVSGTTLKITGNINLDGVGNGDGGTLTMDTPTPTPFTVGGPITDSGVTGSISANGAGTGKGGNITLQNSFSDTNLDLVVNSSISAMPDSSAFGGLHLLTPDLKQVDVTLTGPGTVNAAISNGVSNFSPTGAFNSVLINLPNQNKIDIGKIRTTTLNLSDNSDITISANEVNLFSGSILSSSGGNIVVNAPIVTNNGTIATLPADTPGKTLTFQSSSNLSITGNGAIVGMGKNVFFNSAGDIFVRQGSLSPDKDSYIANAPGNIDVSFSAPVSTSSLLALAARGVEGVTAVQERVVLATLVLPDFRFNSSSVVSTDSVPRHISFDGNGGDDDSGVVDVGEHKFVVTNNLQSLSAFVASDDSLEFAEEGTEVKKEDDKVYLSRGKMVVSTGKKSESLSTPEGELKVNPNSTVVVHVSVSGTVSAASLNGSTSLTKSGGESSISIEKGEELVSNKDGLEEEELIPVDGVERGEVITAGLTKQGGRATVKRTVSVKQMISKDIMINGSLIHVRGATKKQHNSYVENLKSSSDSQAPVKPIAYVQSVQSAAQTTNPSSPSKSALTLSSAGTNLRQSAPGFIKLDSGDLFLHAKSDTVIGSKFCNVIAKKGCCLNISTSNEKTTIRVCSGVKSAKVLVGKNASLLSAGEELVISKRNLKNTDVYNSENIGHRNTRTMHCLGYYFAHSDFSIPALLSSKDYLRSLLHAKDYSMISLRERVLKSAVTVQMVQGKYGRYSLK